jgi:pyruvate formate lyase activating enzyme
MVATTGEEKALDLKGLIFDIQHFSIQDGPGIRTTVFFKGCPLHCLWCHNPESISFHPEIAFYKEFCIDCRHCLEVCPNGCHRIINGERVIRRDLCKGCGLCMEACCSRALVLKGRKYTVNDVLGEVEQDRPFYERSGGGVTLSGGEPLAQAQFCRELLKGLKRRGIHTVVDTSGYVPWKVLEGILKWTDLFLYDIKCYDTQLHRRLTGVDNIKIKSNLKRLSMRGAPLVARIPVIPGCNDQPAEMKRIAELIGKLKNATTVHILPYHQFAEQKYGRIGMEYGLKGLTPPSPNHLRELAQIFEGRRIPVVIMGIEKSVA